MVSAKRKPGLVTCMALGAGSLCGMPEGEAICTLDEPEEWIVETCEMLKDC